MSSPQGPARAGRRDPELRRRVQRDEGVVARVTDEPDETPEPDLYPEAEMDLVTEGEGEVADYALLLPGDIVAVKTSVQGKDFSGDEVWHSVGVQTRVQPDEDAETAFSRATYLANQGVINTATDFEARQAELAQERRTRPIRPTR